MVAGGTLQVASSSERRKVFYPRHTPFTVVCGDPDRCGSSPPWEQRICCNKLLKLEPRSERIVPFRHRSGPVSHHHPTGEPPRFSAAGGYYCIMDMMDITLIVKASNQQFEDQTIKCEPSWTIRRLKGHLTEVYPGKPSTDEQKLIYSGQLLGDSVILKDILRHYDGQQTHTVHLVFTPKNNRFQKDFSSASGTTSNGSSSSSNQKNMSSKVNGEAVPAASSSTSRAGNDAARQTSSDIGADGLRQRNVGGGQDTATTPVAACQTTPATNNYMEHHLAMQNLMQQAYMQYLNQYMNVISGQANAQALYASAPTNLPTSTVQPQSSVQTTAPTIATAQNVPNPNPILAQTLPNLAYYPYLPTMNSPMPSASSIPAPISSSGTIPTSSASAGPSSQSPTIPTSPQVSSPLTAASSGPTGTVPTPPGAAGVSATPQAGTSTTDGSPTQTGGQSPQVDNANAAPAAGAAVPGAAGAAAAPARRFPNIVVEEQENRDWLDIFFSLCRVGILMTVVYLYSSPVRCLTVLFIGIALYLYQIGFFRNNADPMERARRIVVQEMNNAHGIRQNAALRARVARQVAAAGAAAAPGQQQAEPAPNAATASDADTTDSPKTASTAEPTTDSPQAEVAAAAAAVSPASDSETAPSAEAATADHQLEGPSNAVPEANRVNLNDVAGFLRTLVLSFFTSIIPDTPAA